MQSIEWRPVVGYEHLYQVSSDGQVRRTALSYAGVVPGRVLKQIVRETGHRYYYLCKDGKSRTYYVHGLMLEAFVGPRPEGAQACHNDGDPTNNVLSNLRWDSPKGNARDRMTQGNDHNTNKTHCPRNHPLIAPNLVANQLAKGFRACRACGRAWSHANSRNIPFDPAVADEKFRNIMAGFR